jgi:ABC-type multidrug transport system fused ATPase/permease subunit
LQFVYLFADVGIYSGLNGTEAVFMLLFLYTMTRFLYRSGKFLHEKALAGIIRAPVSFFDRTPMGRAIARFSVDFTTIDIQLGPILILMFVSGFNLASTLFSMSLGAPWMLIVAIPSTIFCFIFQRYYQLASIQVKRLESASKAPIYSHFGETIAGASSVRAFAISDQFKRGMDKRVDENNICVMGNRYTTSWFNLRLSMVVMLIQATAYITTGALSFFLLECLHVCLSLIIDKPSRDEIKWFT